MTDMKAPRTVLIGYLMNIHPMTSTTFIRREIEALEKQGLLVQRYAIKRWSETLVDPKDVTEQSLTHYLLSGRTKALALSFLGELLINPKGMATSLPIWWKLWRNGGGLVRHLAYLMEAVSLKRQALLDGVSHIHAHFSTNSAAVAMLSEKLGGPGYSFTTHGPDELIDPSPSSLGLKLKEARFAVAITHYCKTRLSLAGGAEVWDRLHVVRCGIPIKEFVPNADPIRPDAPFVCVGRLCPQKAQVLITQAVMDLVADFPNLRVVFIGDGDSRNEIEALIAQHGLQENITLLGWQTNAEVRQHLGTARALLLPSFAEGLPIAIMEAMALERPVISTFIAGIPELLDGKAGWIIPAGSKSGIERAMRAALCKTPSELKEMGEEGYRRIVKYHNVDANAAELKNLILESISKSPR